MRRLGYLPEAVNNWTALMGWSYDDRTEFFLMADLIEKFSLEKLKPSPAAVNFSKLDHFNGLHIRALPVDDLTDRLVPWFESAGFAVDRQRLARIVPLLQERIRTLDEAVEMAGFFFADEVTADAASLVGKDMDAAQTAQALERARDVVEQHEKIEAEPLEADLRALADDLGLSAGQLFGILRMAVTGQRVSPPLLESMELEGKETVVRRMEAALASLATA
jgi:glutamyl-tRNA synthetase